MDVLAPDVVLLNDGGGKVRAALRPVVTADKVARLLVGLRAGLGEVTYTPAVVNGRPGAFIYLDGTLDTVVTVEIEGDRVSASTWSGIRTSWVRSAAPRRWAGRALGRCAHRHIRLVGRHTRSAWRRPGMVGQ